MILAQTANNAAIGSWIVIAFAVVNGVVGIIAIFSLFATKRELDKQGERIDKLEEGQSDIGTKIETAIRNLDRSDEARTSAIHNRLNPLDTRAAKLEGAMEAFTMSFEKFTRIIESTSHKSDDQMRAFIGALDTFASVIEKEEKKR